MNIKYLTITKRNLIYRGPSDSKKFSDFFGEVQENLSGYMSNLNELTSLISQFASGNLNPIPSGFIHPSGYALPDPSGYITANSHTLSSLEKSFETHLMDEFSNQ